MFLLVRKQCCSWSLFIQDPTWNASEQLFWSIKLNFCMLNIMLTITFNFSGDLNIKPLCTQSLSNLKSKALSLSFFFFSFYYCGCFTSTTVFAFCRIRFWWIQFWVVWVPRFFFIMSPAQKTEGSFVTLKEKFVLCMFIKKRHFQDRFCIFILSVRVFATVGPLKVAVCVCVRV